MQKKFLLYTVCWIIAQTTFSQEAPQEHAKKITSFGFRQFFGGIVVVSATLNNITDSLNFILDTGSSGISLDSSTVDEMKLPVEPSDISIVGIAGTRILSFVRNCTLNLPGLSVNKLDFHIANYEVLSETYGVKIDGIIGYSFLRQFIVEVNYDSLKMSVYSPGIFRYAHNGHILKPSFTRIPIVDLFTKERSKMTNRYYFDIGAGLALLISQKFAKDSSYFLSKRKPVISQVEGLGGKAEMQLTVSKRLKIGPYSFHNVPTYIFDDPNNVLSYPVLSGLVGNDLLRRFNTVFNYPAREIFIQPNSHYNEAFDYSYSGLNIYFVNGRVVVGEVMENSPADEAGFLPGDIVFGIGSNFSNNIQKYKELIQSSGKKLSVIVIRDEKAMMLTLKIKSIK